ncbi:MAG: biopolymer transporter ExbD [Proteobacteria bacterium]|nr:biopolymer transporter ExbD [Pseudomonadota bacterium]
MQIPPSRRRRGVRENVVPLINVVFLLLIFFLLAGTLREPVPFDVEPPMAGGASGGRLEPGAERVLHLARDGRLALAGKEVALAELPAALALSPTLADRAEEIPLRLRADARVPARTLIPLLEALRDAGVREVELVTRDVGAR